MEISKRTIIPLMLLGDGQAGKTELVLSFLRKQDDSFLTTIGKEFYVYETELHGHKLKYKIWDTAGQERFKSMSVNIIKNVEGIIMVYSITSRASFNNLYGWLEQLNNIDDLSKKQVIIIGNKLELEEYREVSYEEGEKFAKENGFHFYETSSKTRRNVDEAFYDIFEQLYKKFEDEIIGKKFTKNKILIKKSNTKSKKKCA